MIFGTQHSKFVSGVNEVELTNSRIKPDWNVPSQIMHKSIITGYRSFVNVIDYSFFPVTVFLYQEIDPNAKLQEIKTYRNSLVSFYPYSDGEAVKDSNGEEVQFFITISPFYLNNENIFDGCLIKFVSISPSIIKPSALAIITTEGGIDLTTEDGRELII